MKFYRFDKYIINNGISLRKNYIYDKRIDELIKLDNEDCINVSFPGYFDLIKSLTK